MSNNLRVHWTIAPRTEPQPWLNCSRCRGPRCFRSSGKIRVDANGRRIDAWLIYRCVACDGTGNRPIVERRVPQPIGRRADRLLARELQLSRSAIGKLATAAQILTVPPGVDLRRPLRAGLRLIIATGSVPGSAIDPATGTLGELFR